MKMSDGDCEFKTDMDDAIYEFNKLVIAHKDYIERINACGKEGIVVCEGNFRDHLHLAGNSAWPLVKKLGLMDQVENRIHSENTIVFWFFYNGLKILWLV